MTPRLSPVFGCVLLAVAAFAQTDVKAKADAAIGGDKAKLAVEYTQEATKSADAAYKQGKDEEGDKYLLDIAQYAKLASDAAMQSSKHEKDTEINLRKIVNRLVDIKNTRPYDQQDQVQKTIDSVDSARNALLEFMFQRKHK
jgi:hypothetical protein